MTGTCLNFCCAPPFLVSREAKKKLPRVQERRARFSQKMWTEVSLSARYFPFFSSGLLTIFLHPLTTLEAPLPSLSFNGFDSRRHLWYVQGRKGVRSGSLFSWFPSCYGAVACLCPSTYDHISCWKVPPLSSLRQMLPSLALSATR